MGSWMWDEDEEEPVLLDKAGANRRERQRIEVTMPKVKGLLLNENPPGGWPNESAVWFHIAVEVTGAGGGETGLNKDQVCKVGDRVELHHDCAPDNNRRDVVYGEVTSISKTYPQTVIIEVGETHNGEGCDCAIVPGPLTLMDGDTLSLKHDCRDGRTVERLDATIRGIYVPPSKHHATIEVKRA